MPLFVMTFVLYLLLMIEYGEIKENWECVR